MSDRHQTPLEMQSIPMGSRTMQSDRWRQALDHRASDAARGATETTGPAVGAPRII
ncbi:hypothetical protein PC129_g15569 [Phytophthora cactorum]|uniref:Uncharacterized protein n=1 Tax=Phytophthora cactorum TaxID=29920 RepID=A0A8T1HMN8_9STRA|nr:hypothetical protein Pcac1_g3662 [Phytophthora cactorum]KAG2901856.1 hypothetical protein PC114_g12994 [Phytophthora cactorum]KAG2923038.1 hypothetical protein PC117_g15828 [Phytophthora cactorum]KAG3009014.1 hypothetical protein PC120_g15876 [Phytophthora cactorum]KAG3031892.1 hypothetical protein PC119_g5849 [Phytophthora cactorum]